MWVETTDDRLVVGVTLPVAVERTWGALTAPGSITRWWGSQVRLDAREGGSLLERWDDGDGPATTMRGRVICCQPPRRLVIEWADAGWPGDTTVEFRLEKDGDRTWLRLEHRGWAGLPAKLRAASIAQRAADWRQHLGALGVLLGLEGDIAGDDPDGNGQSAAASAPPPV